MFNVLLPNQQPRFQADKIIDQPRFQSNIPLNRWYIARIFQIWPTLIGCKELAERFEPIRNGEIFWMNNKTDVLFFSKLANGRNPPNPAIWLVQGAGGFLLSCPLTRAESLPALFTSLFVVCEWAKPVTFNQFFLKLALLLALAREKWILLFRQNIWKENQASEPGKPLK